MQPHLRERMPQWREHYQGVETMTVAMMGCVVNGPGESKQANIGISLPGTGEAPPRRFLLMAKNPYAAGGVYCS